MSRFRLRHRQLALAVGIGAAITLLICTAVGIWIMKSVQGDYSEQRSALEIQLVEAQEILNQEFKEVPLVSRARTAGDQLSAEDIAMVRLPVTALPENSLALEDVIGKYTKISLPRNTPVTASMLFTKGVTAADIRNQEFRLIQLPQKLKQREFVDVRIKFPTGEDFIVLSKKEIKDLSGDLITYEMSEEEILMMSSAIVDAYIHDATIYALSYVDPYMQKNAVVTYPPKQEVRKLIQSDPNIVAIATKQLEIRKRETLEAHLINMSEADRQNFKAGAGIQNQSKNGLSTSYIEKGSNEYTSELPPVMSSYPTSSTDSTVDVSSTIEGSRGNQQQDQGSKEVYSSLNNDLSSEESKVQSNSVNVSEAEDPAATVEDVIYGQQPEKHVEP
ncbi:SAF domain-containing protein [Paenibacillus massiliensis]|uniref:SAF domain-containing protein n=1 Tax=Paenibacillus massiliensis TaxID=225917 RepID=UPI00046F01F7|nr:SAF domain-containing protein [Paenibacillus massiliensis]